MTHAQLIYITTKSKSEAKAIASELLKNKLVACANIIGNMNSMYWWQGNIESSDETILILKSTANNFSAIESNVKKLHSYDLPCIIAFDINSASKSYLDWIQKETHSLEK